ncbi:AraC family transcriptional regulator [Kitasatospora sp. RG8]|uniref:AraC family transcriptional regulator n=1 Tax=Kitasatospora sp. RG8 TaxID=2820815 RepID=UPI001AE05367|nr:AraC family transcriptional regulator [Kitasatospora sp. RG8]MBP0454239.1 AraC family transcriptional regulator [Kitasatospora sp. RG8]
MDTLTGLLDGPKARGAFVLRSILSPPWSLRIEDGAPLSVVAPIRGDAWILPEGGAPVLLRPGDVAIVRGPEPYTVADRPDTPVQVVIGPGQVCSRDGADVSASMALGVRTWGEVRPGDDNSSVLLSGTYQAEHEIGRRLLDHLPTLLVRPAGENAATTEDTLVRLLAAETTRDEPGQELVLDRLLDLLVVGVLRSWLATPDSGAPAWYQAQHDQVVGPVLRLMHDDPARPWTVAALAAEVGVSRAGLARRFTALVGEPPMAYLATWRLALAADLLRDPGHTVASVARRVGYSNAFALSAAFKRVRGVTPQEHRRLAGEAPPAAPPFTMTTVVLAAG